VIDAVADLPEVAAVTGLGWGGAMLDGAQQDVSFADTAVLPGLLDLEVVAGDVRSLGEGGIALSSDHADRHGLALGDRVELGFTDGSTATLSVGAVYDVDELAGDALVDRSVWEAHNRQASSFVAFVGLADGTGVDGGRDAIVAATRDAGSPAVLDRDGFVRARASEVDTLLQVIYGLLAVAIVIAVIGIANTLSLSVHERARELGVLRAVGQTRSQLRSMVRWESVVVAIFGAVGGLGLGVFLGWGVVRAMSARTALATFQVPVGLVVVILATGVAVGVVAGARPAWRAGRADILAAS
jgi:putative ABC transport system permease protein